MGIGQISDFFLHFTPFYILLSTLQHFAKISCISSLVSKPLFTTKAIAAERAGRECFYWGLSAQYLVSVKNHYRHLSHVH